MKSNRSVLEGMLDKAIHKHAQSRALSQQEIDTIKARLISEDNETWVNIFTDEVYRNAPYIVKENRKTQKEYSQHISNSFNRIFTQFETIIGFSLEVGKTLGKDFAANASNPEFEYLSRKHTFYALLNLHGRGILVSKEIHCLLTGGFPNAALGRWRTLYELAVHSEFIATSSDQIGNQYLDYGVVERKKEINDYQRTCEILGYEPLAENDILEIEIQIKNLKGKYGDHFPEPYGWARDSSISKIRKLDDLIRLTTLKDYISFYRWANNAIHAGPKGGEETLGNTIPNSILVGPSEDGFVDAIQMTSLMLVHCTKNLLTFPFVLEDTIKADIMMELHYDLIDMLGDGDE